MTNPRWWHLFGMIFIQTTLNADAGPIKSLRRACRRQRPNNTLASRLCHLVPRKRPKLSSLLGYLVGIWHLSATGLLTLSPLKFLVAKTAERFSTAHRMPATHGNNLPAPGSRWIALDFKFGFRLKQIKFEFNSNEIKRIGLIDCKQARSLLRATVGFSRPRVCSTLARLVCSTNVAE